MIVISCQHETTKKHGKDRKGNQRFRCLCCGKTFVEETAKPLGNMRITMKQATMALDMLLEGMSIRATSRLTGMDAGTICDLILLVGENCQRFLDAKERVLQRLPQGDDRRKYCWITLRSVPSQQCTRRSPPRSQRPSPSPSMGRD